MTPPPDSLTEMQSYMERVVDLLSKWQWLFKSRPIDILKKWILEGNAHLLEPLSTLNLDELNRVPFGFVKDDWPDELKEFIFECDALNFEPEKVRGEYKMSGQNKKMSPKKLHETSRLSSFVARKCNELDARVIVDIGAGLGYIDRAICQLVPRSLVVAVECDSVKCDTAERTNVQAGLQGNIEQMNLSICASNIEDVCRQLDCVSSGRATCLVALHACGDLTVNCFKIFQQVESIKCAVLASCCYHKVPPTYGVKAPIFPQSHSLTETILSSDLGNSVGYLLRIAAETTRESWVCRTADDHRHHANSVFFRAIIEKFIADYKLRPVRAKLPQFKTWEAYSDFWLEKVYVKIARRDFPLAEATTKLQQLYKDNLHLAHLVTPFNCLQNCLQAVAENLVTVDRMMGLKERGVENVNIVQIFDKRISPRCNAFVLSKHET